MKRLILVIAMFAFAATACGGDAGDPTGRTWTMVEVEGSPALEATLVTLTFSDGQISGSGGCNNYTGSATWGEGDLVIDPTIAATMRACEEPVMDQESAFLAALPKATSYRVRGDELELLGDGGSVLVRLSAS